MTNDGDRASANGWTGRVVLAATATTRGGVWRHLSDLAHGLLERGCDVRLAFVPAAEELHAAAEASGLRWIPLRAAVRTPADIWQFEMHWTFEKLAFQTVMARRAFGPVIILEHLPRSHESDSTLAPYFERTRGAQVVKTAFKSLEYGAATRVIAVSQTSAEFLRKRYLIDPEKVVLVRNGIDPRPPCDPPAPRAGQLKVLAYGSLIWQKGFDLLIAAAALSDGGWTADIRGSGYEIDHLREQAEREGRGRVQVNGWLDDPHAAILDADVVCMPSRWESMPYAALEANAAARPLVATRVDGLDEVVVPEQTGLLVDTEDPRALASALDHLAANPDLVRQFGAAAARRVQNYTVDAMVDGTVAVYRTVSRA